jgi:GNAT superfamily N-acetyltransferase
MNNNKELQTQYRRLTAGDIDIFIELRFAYLANEFKIHNPEKDKIETNLRTYFNKYISTGNFIGMICESDTRTISAGYLHISERLPNPNFINGKIGTLMNVFTFPEYRNNGIATGLIKLIIEEAKKEGVTMIELSATERGEEMYRKIGFKESAYKSMRLMI